LSSKKKEEQLLMGIRRRVLGFISDGASSGSDAPTLHDILRHFHTEKGSDLLVAVETLSEEFLIYTDRNAGYKLL
jgi:chemotaxis protein histidine kinase CheA